MYEVNAQGVDERMINVHYYYYFSSLVSSRKKKAFRLTVISKSVEPFMQTSVKTLKFFPSVSVCPMKRAMFSEPHRHPGPAHANL